MRKITAVILKVIAALLVTGGAIAAALEFRDVYAAIGTPGGVPHGGLVGVLLRLGLAVLLAGVAVWASRRVADPNHARATDELHATLATIWAREKPAAGSPDESGSANPYSGLGAAELLDCYTNIDRASQPQRFAQLLSAVRAQVEGRGIDDRPAAPEEDRGAGSRDGSAGSSSFRLRRR